MKSTSLSLTLLLASSGASAFNHHRFNSRSFISPTDVSESYDFVIVGGGLAGLVVASRLSEDPDVSILVLEAGDNGDSVRDRIDHPGLAYQDGILHSEHDWMYQTTPQNMIGNREITWPMGKILGGSSAANGMYIVRPSSQEVDAWHSLIKDMDGSDSWTSDAFFAAMRKSEQFTPPSDEIRDLGNIAFNEDSHGQDGPLHTTYPAYLPPVVGSWIASLGGIGISPSSDAYGGEAWGAYLCTSSINPTNWTRSYSRSAYIDPYYRPNLHILTDAQVARVVFDGTKAIGVEYGTDRKQVGAKKEVILSAGPVGSPATLLRSGVGPLDVLELAGVETVVELPGVGQHLQDHLATGIIYRTTSETAATVYNNPEDPRSRSAEFLSYVNSAIAYVNTAQLVGDWEVTFREEVMANMTQSVEGLLPSQDPAVIEGYKAVYRVTGETLLNGPTGQIELLLQATGTGQGADTIAIQVALQRPFSHGHLWINSTDPLMPPVIDPGYLSHPADIIMLREGLKMARRLGETDPIKSLVTEELVPGGDIQSDAQWEEWLRGDVHTEFHPSCTCSMLPREQGGVVDAQLKVYGVDNLRVIDSSVFPIEFAAHMMAPTYGLAEEAANIIKAQYGTKSSGNGGNNGNNGNNNGGNKDDDSAAGSVHAGFGVFVTVVAVAFASILA